VLLPQGASPNTHAASSDTKVTEFGANPAGTAAPGVGCAVGVGDDEIGVAVGVVTAVGATVGVGDVGPGDGAHAVSNTQAAPAEATRNRIEAVVCVINTANSIETMRVPGRAGSTLGLVLTKSRPPPWWRAATSMSPSWSIDVVNWRPACPMPDHG
jgi:hypothetical protein